MAPARTVSFKKPEIRRGEWKTTLEERYGISVESEAVSDHAGPPSRECPSPPRRREGAPHDSEFEMGSAMSDVCSDRATPGLRLSVCQHPKLQLWADTGTF